MSLERRFDFTATPGIRVVTKQVAPYRQEERVVALNILGQEKEINVNLRGEENRFNWQTKYLTENCGECEHYISPDIAKEVLVEVLRRTGQRQRAIPEPQRQKGLCLWGDPDHNKVLVENERRPLGKCQSFGKTRDEHRKERGYPQK